MAALLMAEKFQFRYNWSQVSEERDRHFGVILCGTGTLSRAKFSSRQIMTFMTKILSKTLTLSSSIVNLQSVYLAYEHQNFTPSLETEPVIGIEKKFIFTKWS